MVQKKDDVTTEPEVDIDIPMDFNSSGGGILPDMFSKDGRKKIGRALGKITGLVDDLEDGIQLCEGDKRTQTDKLEKKRREFEEFEGKVEDDIQEMTDSQIQAANAVKGFRAILAGKVG